MPFAVAAAGIGAVGTIAGGIMQKNAIDKGQKQATEALDKGIQTATNQLSPWTTTGVPANQDQSALLGLQGQDAANKALASYQTSPGYTWQMGEGLRAVDAGAAASGMLRSGAALKAEQTFGQGLANSDFGNYWNRLQQLSGSGSDAAKGIASAATGGAQNIAQVDTGAASMDASIYGNMVKGVSGAANQLLSNQGFQSWAGGSGGASVSGVPQSSYSQMPGANLGWT